MQSSGGSGVRSTTSSFANAGGGPGLIGFISVPMRSNGRQWAKASLRQQQQEGGGWRAAVGNSGGGKEKEDGRG